MCKLYQIHVQQLRYPPGYDRSRLEGPEMDQLVQSMAAMQQTTTIHVNADLTVQDGWGGRRLEAARRLCIETLWCMVDGQSPPMALRSEGRAPEVEAQAEVEPLEAMAA